MCSVTHHIPYEPENTTQSTNIHMNPRVDNLDFNKIRIHTIYVCELWCKTTNMYIHIYRHVCMCSVTLHFPMNPITPLIQRTIYMNPRVPLYRRTCHPYTREYHSISEHRHSLGCVRLSIYLYCDVKAPTCKYKYVYISVYMCKVSVSVC